VLGWLEQKIKEPICLVIGSGGIGIAGADPARTLYSDVAHGPYVDIICDAHDLPFAESVFDLVICVAVLEHVVDPQRCVAEIHRVLRPGGRVFAVTPFLQPVHMGAHDFTRFTPIGHRRLFRYFDEEAAGVALGVGTSFAMILREFLRSVCSWSWWRTGVALFATLARVALGRLDRFLDNSDGAGGVWFLGVRSEHPVISDRELVMTYRDKFRQQKSSLHHQSSPPV